VPGENYCECLQTGFALSLPLEWRLQTPFSSLQRSKLWHLHHGWPLSKLICTYPQDFVAFSHTDCKLLVTTGVLAKGPCYRGRKRKNTAR
jgi:hypothetical protein